MTAYRQTPISRSRHVLALDFIRQFFVEHGSSPSFSEIGSALIVSDKHVGRIICELAADGLIAHTKGKPRSIVLPELIDNYSDRQLLLELMRRGWVVNPGKVVPTKNAPVAENVAKCGVPLDALIADIDRVTGETGDGDGGSRDQHDGQLRAIPDRT